MNTIIYQLFTGLLLTLSVTVLHAETCQIIDESSGVLKVKCRGKTYNAIDPAFMKQLMAENTKNNKTIKTLNKRLKETNVLVKDQESLLNGYRGLNEDYMSLNDRFNDNMKRSDAVGDKIKQESQKLLKTADKFDQLATKYNDLCSDYRELALNASTGISFDVGGGVTKKGGEYEPAMLVGVNFSSFHVWGLLQDDNNGVLVGKSFGF